jgi:hypothetical protein
MSKSKTPLELINSIKTNTVGLFEIRRISKALKDIVNNSDAENLRTIVKAFTRSLDDLSNNASDIYWDIAELKDIIEKDVLESTKDVEEDLPFVTPDEEVENS